MKRKILAVILSLVLVISLLPVAALAVYSDSQDHWAEEAIDKWSANGIIQGYDGKFRPEDPITRGELAIIIDRLMKYQTAAENTFADLDQNYYTEAILKANAAGVITGYDGKVRPADSITREEAVVMLCRAFGLDESSAASGFTDSASISQWARGSVNAMAARGFVHGWQGAFNPLASISRAEIVTVLDNAVAGFYTEEKEYTGDVSGIAIINAPDVVLKDMTIDGDLIIAEGVGSGDVTLQNVVVTGNTIVRGGGADSIHIVGGSQIGNLIIEKTDSGQIRVVTSDGAAVEVVYVDDGNDDIILTGSFESVSITAGVSVRVVDAVIGTVKVTGENARIDIDAASSISTLSADAPVTVDNKGTITKAEVNVENVTITGNEPKDITYATGVAGDVDKDDTPGGGGPVYVAVRDISVTGEGDSTIVINGRTLQMSAEVAPINATNKAVTWSVTNGAGSATISTSGLLTATGVGDVTVTAEANNGIKGNLTITIVPENTVAMIGTTQYESIGAAVVEVQSGQTITMITDAYGGGIKVPSGKNFTLDLCGYTYTIDRELVGSSGTETNGFQLLKDSDITIKNGTITTTIAKILIQKYSNLILDNVELIGVDATLYVLSNNNGKTTLKNGTTITAAEGKVAFDVYYWPKNGYKSVSVEIADSNVVINGKVEYASDGSDNAGFMANASLTIPADYTLNAPDGYKWAAKDGMQVLVYTNTVAMIGNMQYTTLQETITAAKDGDTITITAGTYDEIVNVSNISVTITGAGKSDTFVKAVSAYPGAGNTLTISNLTVYGNNNSGQSGAGIFISNGTVIIENCDLVAGDATDKSKHSLETQYNNSADIVVRNCIFSGYKQPYFNPSTGTLTLENNNFNGKGPSVDPPYNNATVTGNTNMSIGLFIGYGLLRETHEKILSSLSSENKAFAIAIHQNNPGAVVILSTNDIDTSIWGRFYTTVENGELIITGRDPENLD